jgi:hypothetical protein
MNRTTGARLDKNIVCLGRDKRWISSGPSKTFVLWLLAQTFLLVAPILRVSSTGHFNWMKTFTSLLTTNSSSSSSSSSSEKKVLSQSLRRRVPRKLRFPEDECRRSTRFVMTG